MENQIREMTRVKAHLVKIRKGLILTSPNSDPRVRGFAALALLPSVALLSKLAGYTCRGTCMAKGPGAEGTVRTPHSLGG